MMKTLSYTLALVLCSGGILGCKEDKAPQISQELLAGREALAKDPAAAASIFRRAVASGQRGQAELGLASALEASGSYSQAEEVLAAVQKRRPADLEVALALGRVRLVQGDQDGARQALETLLTRKPAHVPGLLLLSALAVTGEQAAACLAALEQLRGEAYAELRPSTEFSVTRAALLQVMGKLDDAQRLLETAKKSQPLDGDASIALANALKLGGKPEHAEWLLRRLVDTPAASSAAHKLLAGLALDLGHLTMAADSLQVLPTELNADAHTLYLKSRLHQMQGNHVAAAAALERAKQALDANAPKRSLQQLGMARARALSLARDLAGARAELEAILLKDRGFAPAQMALAGLLLEQGTHQEAIAWLDALTRKPAPPDQAFIMLVSAHQQAGDLEGAQRAAERFTSSAPESTHAIAQLATVLSKRKRLKEGLQLLRDGLKRSPESLQLAKTLIQLVHASSGVDAAVDTANELAGSRKDPYPVMEIVANIYSNSKRDEEARAEYSRLAKARPMSIEIWASLAGVQERLGDLPGAVTTMKRGLEHSPKSERGQLLTGNLLGKMGRDADAVPHYETAIGLNPESVMAYNNLASLLCKPGSDSVRGVQLAEQARKLAPDSPATADTLGWCLLHRKKPGDLARAQQLLRTAAQKLQTGEAYFHLGVALARDGKLEQARLALTTATEKGGFLELAKAKSELAALKKK